jgi:hypothetical protein
MLKVEQRHNLIKNYLEMTLKSPEFASRDEYREAVERWAPVTTSTVRVRAGNLGTKIFEEKKNSFLPVHEVRCSQEIN